MMQRYASVVIDVTMEKWELKIRWILYQQHKQVVRFFLVRMTVVFKFVEHWTSRSLDYTDEVISFLDTKFQRFFSLLYGFVRYQ